MAVTGLGLSGSQKVDAQEKAQVGSQEDGVGPEVRCASTQGGKKFDLIRAIGIVLLVVAVLVVVAGYSRIRLPWLN